MKQSPNSDDDWTIHSLNIHGLFFERWCQEIINQKTGWQVKTSNYPVEFPTGRSASRSDESALDIWAEQERNGNRFLNCLVECKKNNPDFVNWVFFLRPNRPRIDQIIVRRVENSEVQSTSDPRQHSFILHRVNLQAPFVDEARETRGSYAAFKSGGKTKTANKAISEALYQVALATQAICEEQMRFIISRTASNPPVPTPKKVQVFIPTIVTSANLFTCQFDPKDVDPKTGEIPYDKAALNNVDFVIYEYPLPQHLQVIPGDLAAALARGSVEDWIRMHVLIVHGESLKGVLSLLEKDLHFT